MKKFEQTILLLFFASALINLWSEFQPWQLGIWITKPLLMTTLGIYFWLKTRIKITPLSFFLPMGLFFSLFGDCFMMFADRGNAFFLLGLGSFLFTHIFYILAFSKYPSDKKGLVRKQPVWIFPFILYLIWISWFMWDGLAHAMKVPVVLYSLVIAGMVVSVLNLNGKISTRTFQTIFAGALLFMLSDSLIGLTKFGGLENAIPQSRFLIMATYILGQYLIVKGSIAANNEA